MPRRGWGGRRRIQQSLIGLYGRSGEGQSLAYAWVNLAEVECREGKPGEPALARGRSMAQKKGAEAVLERAGGVGVRVREPVAGCAGVERGGRACGMGEGGGVGVGVGHTGAGVGAVCGGGWEVGGGAGGVGTKTKRRRQMRTVLALVVGVGAVWGQAAGGPPVSGHCTASTGMSTLSNHEVPIIVEDGSIRLLAYRSHFDVNILNRISPPPNTKVMPAATPQATGQTTGPNRVGAWHTHNGDHVLQVAVAVPNIGSMRGAMFRTQLHQFTMYGSDKVELLLERDGTPKDSVWLSKEVDPQLSSACHPTGVSRAEKLAWVMRGTAVMKKPTALVADTAEYANLEYFDAATQQPGILRLRGVKVWNTDPAKYSGAIVKAEFKLGNGCSSVQVCPNDKDGTPVCRAMNPPCSPQIHKATALDPGQMQLVQ